MASEIWFYHLERTGLHVALCDLLEKVIAKPWRAYIYADEARFEPLSQALWTYRDEGFLAHGVESHELSPHQPILLGSSGKATNKADVFFSISPRDLPDLKGFQRSIILFEGADEDHLNWARAQWTKSKSPDVDRAYFKQTVRGNWEKVG